MVLARVDTGAARCSVTEGAGKDVTRELVHMEPGSLEGAINRFLDLGVDLLTGGGTSPFGYPAR